MKKGLILIVLLAAVATLFAQQPAPQWNNILSGQPESYRKQLVSASESSVKVNVQVPGFYTANVTTPRGEAKVVTLPKAVSTAHAGEPDLPMTGIPVLIGDHARMNVRVLEAQYMDFEGIEVAPSKGDFPRTISPDDVPYTYGACYDEDAFFPASNVGLYEPYIVRDFRGQNMVVYPFAYNPATKTLRVYYNMTVEMYKVDDNGSNVIETRRSNVVKMDPDFKSLYQRHFINYQAAMGRYTPLDEEGDLLIICYDNFMSNMTDFVNWKKTRGINTTLVGTSTAGSSYTAIKTYIQNQYNANNNLTHVLLVGDVAQIPGYSYSGGGSSYSGLGDNAYGQVVGSDIYNDVIIGRFSASSAARVTTQCNRVITYERDLTTSDTWLKVGEGISRKENGSGHNNEDDYQHINNIRTDLMNYGYTPVYQRYANLTGYDGSSATISSDINSGVGIINYANHGQETAWGANSSGYIYYAVSHVNALTNENKLPFIWSVACLVGKYDHSSDCFAEAWMNATNNNNPTGAIGTLMSYISQPWIPPMWAQDECVDILVESYSNNIKHTWGGTSINGLMGIFDHYSTSEQQAVGTYQAWIVYGDPSLMLRTKTPTSMSVTHTGTITPSDNSYSVSVSNGNGALATITDANHNILGRATVSNGSATISINGTLTAGTELTLCVFGYNKVTYLGTISVNGGTQYTITATANPSQGGTVSGAGTYYSGQSCTLTATPNTGYEFLGWKLNGNVVSTEPSYTFTVTGNATYSATFTAIPQYTIAVQANPTAGGTVSGGGTLYENTSCTLTATANTHYEFVNWTLNGSSVSTNPTYTFTVTGNATYVANFNALTAHTITCNAVENGTISSSPTMAYKNETVTLMATPASGYFFSAWDVRDASNNPITVTNNQFTMPDSDVTVSATFVSGCTVTVAEVEHGTVTATPMGAVPGTTITLTATPETDYYLSTWLVFKTGDVNTTVTVTNNQFTLPAYDVTVVGIFKMTQEAEITIGSGNSNNAYLPTYAYYKYSLTQQIYTAAEVGSAGTITAIAFKVQNAKSATRNIDLYIKHTTKTAFTSKTNWATLSSSDKVYSGNVTFSTSGWTTITLDTPFEYNGTDNLIVGMDDNTGSYVSNSDSPKFYVYSTGANRALYIYNDNTNYNPASSSSYSGTYSTSNNQVTFTFMVPGNNTSLTVAPNAMDGFAYAEGDGPSAVKSVAVIGTDLSGDITVTAPDDYEVSDAENGTYSNTVTLAAGNRGNRETLTYDFEDGWQNWTTFQGSTTSPHSWMHNTEYTAYDSNGNQIVPECHNSSSGMMLSESYISASTSGGSGTAVTPDNYLVSPQIELGGSFAFYAASRMSNYPAEKFSVVLSTSGNTSASSFTETLLTVTLSDNSWNEYTVDLSAYSGMGYVAIRHYDCTDQHLLYVDDVTIVEGEGGTNPSNPTNPTTDLLAANVYVRLKSGLDQGSYSEALTVATGDITSNVSLNGEVFGTLAAGWNWWTPTKAMTLADLETVLDGKGIIINSQDGGFVRYENGSWSGTLSSIETGLMYKVKTNEAVSLTLTGEPAAAATLEILPGYNWFGYTGTQSKSVATAFSGFTPADGDRVVAQNGDEAVYNNGWSGALTNLVPGKGYVYISTANDSKTIIIE